MTVIGLKVKQLYLETSNIQGTVQLNCVTMSSDN